MLWVYAQLCSYHLATGRNERKRRRRGRRVSQPIDSFREKDKRAYLESPFPFSHCVNEIKEEPRAFRYKNQASKEEEVSRTRSRPSLSVCLFHIAHILPERDYSSRGQKFRAPPLNRHPVSPRDILLDYNSRKTRRSR